MGILLNDEEMPYPFNYYHSNINVKVLRERLEALKKAQVRKVVEWGNEKCLHKTYTCHRRCSICWQELLKEAGIER